MLSEKNKAKLEDVRATLKRSEARVLRELEVLGISYQQFQLLKNRPNHKVSLN
ncbi:hypothetical protein OW492_00400 [Psychromonas sp. 14N.309.X.WAT.B.A12]|nr:hypothetical protein [Psychromonas sp. 14N.309.X.WAT.B.A12]